MTHENCKAPYNISAKGVSFINILICPEQSFHNVRRTPGTVSEKILVPKGGLTREPIIATSKME